jgi:hypothetical protein
MPMNKGFVYESPASDFPIVAVVFDSEGLVIHAKAVDSQEAGQSFINDSLANLRDLERHIDPD